MLLRTSKQRRTALAFTAAAVGALLAVTCMPRRDAAPPRILPATTTGPATTAFAQGGAPLTIKVSGIRNRKGQMIFGVFQSADGFPKEASKAVNWQVRDVDGDTMTFTASLPPGRYGASVLHDENRSGDMDRGLGGIPTEGYGVTNNPKPLLRAATFQEATFALPPEGAAMTISMQYF
jgi:uncharacterized protein (DUF2141 family)